MPLSALSFAQKGDVQAVVSGDAICSSNFTLSQWNILEVIKIRDQFWQMFEMNLLPLLIFSFNWKSFDYQLLKAIAKYLQFCKSANGRTPTMHESTQFVRFQLRLQLLIMPNWFILAGLSMSYNFTIFLCAPSKQHSSKHFRLPFFLPFLSNCLALKDVLTWKVNPSVEIYLWTDLSIKHFLRRQIFFWDRYRNNCNNYKFLRLFAVIQESLSRESKDQTSQCIKKCCDGND